MFTLIIVLCSFLIAQDFFSVISFLFRGYLDTHLGKVAGDKPFPYSFIRFLHLWKIFLGIQNPRVDIFLMQEKYTTTQLVL